MVMAKDTAFMLVVAVGSSEDGGTYRASEMFNVVFAVQSGDVRAPKSLSAVEAEEVKSTEIIDLAQRVLAWWLFGDRKEFGGDYLAAVLDDCYVGL